MDPGLSNELLREMSPLTLTQSFKHLIRVFDRVYRISRNGRVYKLTIQFDFTLSRVE